MIKLDFEFETQYGVYHDALYLEDNHNFTEQEIDAMKQQRVDNWLDLIENPPPSTFEYTIIEPMSEDTIVEPMPEDTIVDSIPVDAVLVEDSPVGAI